MVSSRRKSVFRAVVAVGVSSTVVIGLNAPTSAAAENVLRADRAVARSCFANVLPARTPGVDRREVTSTVDGLVQARLAAKDSTAGDWDVAVFDKTTGALVAASTALDSRELAESFVVKGQQLVVQGCRYSGDARTAVLGVDFLAITPQGTPTPGAVAAVAPERAELVRVSTADQQDKNELIGLGLDVTEKADATSVDVVLAGGADRKVLEGSGFRFEVLNADLSATSRDNARKDVEFAAKTKATGLPSGRTTYRHLWEYNFEMKELARRNPGLVQAFTLPHPTVEGIDVVGVEIATNVGNKADGKPVNLLMATHHAREWPSAEHAMEWVYELVDGYSHDGEIRDLVKRTRNIVVPVVNADGFSISREAEPRGDFSRFDYEMKRKNCQASDSPEQYRTGVCKANPAGAQRGTDPNRNYAGFWGGAGASTNWAGETFRGAAPFSEPETRNIRELVSARQVTNLLTLHTYSGLVLRVPGVFGTRPPLDEPANKALGDLMASRNGYTSQPSWALYDTSGTTEDWSYWATGGYGYTMEIGLDGFHPPYETGVVAEYLGQAPAPGAGKGGNRAAFLDMLRNAATPAAHSTLTGSAPRGYELALHKSFQTPTSPVRQPDGSTAPPIYVQDTLDSKLTATGGRFSWAVNPSTRPYVAGRYGREPQAPVQQSIQLANPAGVPAENTRYPTDQTVERIPFTIKGMPEVDNGKVAVTVDWASPSTDWDLYVLDASGQTVTSSANGGTNTETAVLYDPPAGEYTAVLVNYDQADPSAVDDWGTGRVQFEPPVPPTYGPKESYTLTCKDRRGRIVGLADVYVDRGQSVDVGAVCTDSARETKARKR
ncbi:M14 family zinc carboxypeptidase [Umezawaea sp. Da 62-37]|uniref:M14 family zinc carboxypeptidase n=1 Tax=Umezawaea sp. Da 62-37 TaxID=3075927 RepID=UPI0028F70AFA|nr:M14 family zinc carboxypeptidase [Umezawaea sp. Da 62-37]WNV89102.1 M14 family zinc carboxypeptidase [Umezawaea sp. Da 62-37]